MKVTVFAGPTIDAATIGSYIDAEVLGPASFGDVYRVARRRVDAIAIIDGYFDRVAAVWHKEVLWAMSEGVHVFGAASMGALRAAELADFGMVGIGEVFRAYQSGELEDDDEVAVVHGSADAGYSGGSEAMVNIRASMRRAVVDGVCSKEHGEALQQLAKKRFYAERTFPGLLEDAHAAGIEPHVVARLRDWLPEGRVDLKRLDSVRLLEHLQEWGCQSVEPKRVSYRFSATDAWHQAVRLAKPDESRGSDEAAANFEPTEALKVSEIHEATWDAAIVRAIALQTASEAGIRPDLATTRGAVEQLRRALGLLDENSLSRWCAEQHLGEKQAVRFFEDQARLTWALPLLREQAKPYLVDHLRSTGQYGPMVARVAAKNAQQHGAYSPEAELERLGVSERELWQWYFLKRLGRVIPVDLHAYAQKSEFCDLSALRSAVIREFVHERSGAIETAGPR
ncbi:MAG: TfuA-like protein [Pseudomonadota bacterium]